jgi:hypothetical protein
MGGKRSVERAHIHVALEGISVSWDAEMSYGRITLKRPRRSVIAEVNRVENVEWQCLAVA